MAAHALRPCSYTLRETDSNPARRWLLKRVLPEFEKGIDVIWLGIWIGFWLGVIAEAAWIAINRWKQERHDEYVQGMRQREQGR